MGLFSFEYLGCFIIITTPKPKIEIIKGNTTLRQVKIYFNTGMLVWDNLKEDEANNLFHLLKRSWYPHPKGKEEI